MAGQFAGRLALIAFAAVALRGVPARADFAATISNALAALAIFFGLGWVLGELARRSVEEHARQDWQASQAAAERRTLGTG